MSESPHQSSKWWALAGVCLGVLMVTLDGSIVSIAVPTFLRVFGCGLAEVEWVITGYLLVIVVFLLPVAGIARRLGQKRVFLFGLALFTTGSLLCGMAPGIDWLIAFRLVQGCGAVCMTALMSSIVTGAFSKDHLGQALGIVTAAATLGASLGPTIGGFLISWAGWRAVFLVNLPIGLAACLLIARCLPRDLPAAESPAVTLRMRLTLLRNATVSIGLLGRFIAMSVNAAYLFLTPLLLEDALKYSTFQSGLLLAVAPILTGIISPVFGSLADKFGAVRFTLAGLGFMLLATFAMATFSASMTGWEFIAKVVLWGLGLGIFNAPNSSSLMQAVPPEKSGTVSAFFSMAIMLGQMAGVMLAGALFHAFAFPASSSHPSVNIHSLPPAHVASAVAQSLLLFSLPIACLLVLSAVQAIRTRKRAA
jgi:MFS family permease